MEFEQRILPYANSTHFKLEYKHSNRTTSKETKQRVDLGESNSFFHEKTPESLRSA